MIGRGSTTHILTEHEVESILRQGLDAIAVEDKRVLLLIPDHTRTAPMDMMFRMVYGLLFPRLEHLDFLIALGTHPPMNDEAIYHRLGITGEEHRNRYPKARFFNHLWNDPDHLKKIGTISADELAELSGDRMKEDVDVTINRMAVCADLIIIIGPTFPHEVVGFSGGNKYLFPGIAGPAIIDMFHWLGALITSPVIIGTKYTPVRRIVDMAAAMVKGEKYCVNMVVKGNGLAGLYVDKPEAAWKAAAELSDKLHIVYKDHTYKKVLACAPRMYDDLWVGGKCMYKLEPVVADGGELIIYAPHIKDISFTHGEKIEKLGYHVRDYFVKQPELFGHVPGGIKAHSTHVRGIGTFEEGIEKTRIQVTLATQIPEAMCRRLNLNYLDPGSIEIASYQNREEEGILFVEKAGEMLYRLKDDPFNKNELSL